jgi:hypothetical protein
MRLGENFSHMVCGLTSAYSATMPMAAQVEWPSSENQERWVY